MVAAAARIVGALLVAYGVIVLLAWIFQNRIAFPGAHSPPLTPQEAGIADGEAISLTTSDGVQLRGWFLPPDPAPDTGRAPGLIWFYGNMETVYGLAPVFRMFRPPGIGMLVLDYRGYGQSDGTPTEPGLYRDADAAWEYLVARPDVDSTRIGVYGRSLGSAVALYLATERPVRAVVLDSPFSSGRAMAREHYPFLPPALLRLDLDIVGRARRLEVPLLVVHGAIDRIAPVAMGRAVAEAGRAEEFFEIEGSGHNDTYDVGGLRYRDRLHRFLQDHLNR